MNSETQAHIKFERAKLLLLFSLFVWLGIKALDLAVGIMQILDIHVVDWVGLDTFWLATIPLSIVSLLAFASFIQGWLAKKAAQEEEDRALFDRRQDASAFKINEDVRFTAGRSFERFLKYAPATISVLAVISIGSAVGLSWRYWNLRTSVEVFSPEKPLSIAFISTLLMAICLMAGSFCVGQSRQKEFRWLRALGAWLMVAALNLLAATVVALSIHFKTDWALDEVVRRIFIVFYGILGAEFIINLVAEFYRPRTLTEDRPVFESRVLALFTEPGGVMRNIADTLDYQFGFKVSRTWIYAFLESSIVPIILVWLLTLWLPTCLVQIGPNEAGVSSIFGKIVSEQPMKPRALPYLKWPWPIETVERYKVDVIHEVVIGPEMADKDGHEKRPAVVSWTSSHYAKQSKYLVAAEVSPTGKDSEVSLSYLSVSIPIHYRIREEKLIDYAYRHANAKDTLKSIGEMIVTRYFASVDMLQIMSVRRAKAIEDLKSQLQTEADEQELGIEIVTVNFHDAHPPAGGGDGPEGEGPQVAKAYQDVVDAYEQKESSILEAKAYREETIPLAESNAQKVVLEAEAYQRNTVKVSQAESERFIRQLRAYEAVPDVYKLRTYLDFLERDCAKIRKYVLSADFKREVYEINLEEKAMERMMQAEISDYVEKDDSK